MPLPKPWSLPKRRILSDEEAAVLVEQVRDLADLEKNGLDKAVEKNINANRKTFTRLEVYDKNGQEVKNAEIQIEQISHSFKFGCNAFLAGQFDSKEKNEQYEQVFKDLFNQAVVPFYWKDDEPEQNKWRFEKDSPYIYRRPPAEAMLEFCEKVGCEPKGHNLLWCNPSLGLPKWLLDKDKFFVGKAIENRFKILAEKYGSKIPVWDVTNEFIGACDGLKYLPDDALETAWKRANDLFHDNHLILNDFQCLFNPNYYKGKASALYLQAKKLIESGVKLDGIGMQCHLFHNEDMLISDEPQKFTAEHMIEMINTYSTLGKDIHISELTIPSYDGREKYLEMQNIITENMYKIWFSMKNVKSIVWWNLVDNTAVKVSPNAPFDENYFGGGLLLNDFTKKPAYKTLDRLINKEWHTSEKVVTNEKGYASFDGFNGDYEVKIKLGKDEVVKKITVSPEKPLVTIIL